MRVKLHLDGMILGILLYGAITAAAITAAIIIGPFLIIHGL